MSEDLLALLERRAAELRGSGADNEVLDAVDVLILPVARQRIALRLDAVESVVSGIRVTPLPGLSPLWRGVVHVRGRLVAVADLSVLFGGNVDEVPTHAVVLSDDNACALGLPRPPIAGRLRPSELTSVSAGVDGPATAIRGTSEDGTSLVDVDLLLEFLR